MIDPGFGKGARMTWVARLTLAVITLALIRSLWSGLGPPWRWPILLVRAVGRGYRRAVGRRRRRSASADNPDPFTVLEVQHRLGLIATELRVLEAQDADRTYYARAHRIHTRRSAYDQLLAEACVLAGVPAQRPGPEGWVCRTADERFSVEMELAARGWHW
jgi:hypothetical protein